MRLFALILPLLLATVLGSPAPEADKKVKDDTNEYGNFLPNTLGILCIDRNGN